MENIAGRIKELIQAEELSNTEFAKRTEINPAIVSHILSGRNKPSLQVITNIKKTFTNVNLDYLVSGVGLLYNDFTNVNKPTNDVSTMKFTSSADEAPGLRAEPKQEYNAGTESAPPSAEPDKNAALEKEPSTPPAPNSGNKDVEQIVIFFTDGSFKAYNP